MRKAEASFLILWQAQLVSQMGVQANIIAAAFWVKHHTDSPTLVGLVLMAAALPGFLLQPFGGALADHFPKKTLLIICDFLCGVMVLCLTAVMFFFPTHSLWVMAALLSTAASVGALQAVHRPTVMATIPALVRTEKLPAANAMMRSTIEISTMIGAGLGGVLFRVLGPVALFLVDGLSYLFSAITQIFIKMPVQQRSEQVDSSPLWVKVASDTRTGFKFFWSNAGMRVTLTTFALQYILFIPIFVLLPFYIEDFLQGTSDWYGYCIAALGGSGLLGLALASKLWVSARLRGFLLWTSNILYAALMASLGLVHSPGEAVVLFFAIGFFIGYINVSYITLIHINTPEPLRGRVFGIAGLVHGGLAPVAMAGSGIIADLFHRDYARIFAACGLCTLALTTLTSFRADYRKFLRSEPIDGTAEGEIGLSTDLQRA